MTNILLLLGDAGLGTLQKTLVENWIGPAFFIIVAGFAIKFIISRQFRELAGFLGIAAVVALLVFNAGGLFGSKGIFFTIADTFSKALGNGGKSGSDSNIKVNGMIEIFNFLKYYRF